MARILIADDVSMIRVSIRLLLEDSGHEIVAEAQDGSTAVFLCATYHPDVVIMDISMPNLDGIEASRRILERWPETNIIVTSIYGDSFHVKKAGSVGIRSFLVKPFTRVRLLEEIERRLHKISIEDDIADQLENTVSDLER